MQLGNFSYIKSIFLENKTTKQIIFKNAFWIALAIGISKLLKLALIIYIARALGATEYGKFTFALAFISLFVVFQNLGLPNIITREFAREKDKEEEFYSLLSLKILLGFATLILILISSFLITSSPDILKIIWILAIFSLISNFSVIVYAFFRARQKMEYESWATILEALIAVGVGFFIIFNFPSITNISYGYLFSAVASLAFVLVIFHFKVFPLKINWQRSVWRKFLIISWPLALASLFGTIYVYIDSVMMGYLGQITQTGWYNAASKVALFTTVPVAIITASFFPLLSKFFKESKEKLQDICDYYLELMVLMALPLVVGGIVLAPKIIEFIYGRDFFPSILAFQILIMMAGIIFFSKPLVQILIATNQQKKVFWTTVFGAAVNVILNLILIPRFSLYGAAIATVVTYLLVLLLILIFIYKFTPIRILNLKLFLNFSIVGFSSATMYFVISRPRIYDLNLFLSALIGVMVYLFVFGMAKIILSRFVPRQIYG